MSTNFIGVLLPNSPNYTVNTGFSTQLYDAAGSQTITVQTGASLSLLGALGANTVQLSGNASSWQAYQNGSTAAFVHTDGSRIEIAANTVAQTMKFDDGVRSLRIDSSSGAPAVVLGSQTLGTSAAAISADTGTVPTTPDVGSSVKTPWTLVMNAGTSSYSNPSTGGIFTSDGTAAGTGLTVLEGVNTSSGLSSLGVRFNVTTDKTQAYFYQITRFNGTTGMSNVMGVSDGTTSGTKVLLKAESGSNLPGNFATVVNNKFILAGETTYSGDGGKVLVSDGTVAGTSLKATDFAVLGNLIQDAAHQTIWFGGSSAPYGAELVRFNYGSDTSPTVSLVKDIKPGSGSSFSNFSASLNGAFLPDGKLIFSANDGVHGEEPWVSDGTEAGTFLLADFYAGNYGSSSGYTSFNGKVVFSASTYSGAGGSYGQKLVFTDGTAEGTTFIEVNPGLSSYASVIVGQVNGLLYFTSTTRGIYDPTTGVSSPDVKGIFSTDGSSFTRLADINNNASLLGFDANKAYFKVSDASNGEELWAADLVNGGFALVKDILPGSGGSLAGYSATSPFMVGGKLAFNAYTSANQQGLFLSDGTDAGTIQIGSSAPSQTKVIGNTLVFTDASGVHAVNAASSTPTVVNLSSSTVTAALQSDADQAFYLSTTGQLFAATGATAPGAALASNVSNFKVVAEDALFFIQNTSTNTGSQSALWYSDGTAGGTRFIEDLPSGSYDLSNAVGLRAGGVALPPDTAAPVFARATVNGHTLTLYYNDTSSLDAVNLPAVSAFTLGGTSATVSSVAVNSTAKTVVLTLSAEVFSTDKLTLSYTDATSGNDVKAIQDSAGNDAASLVNQAVSNQTPDNVAPLFGSARVSGNTLTLTYTDANLLDTVNLPAASAFTLGGTTATVSSVVVSNSSGIKSVMLTLSAAISSSDVITLSYADPTTGNDVNAIQDSAGNDAASLVNQAVENTTPIKAPWTLLLANLSGIYSSDGTETGTGFVSNAYIYGQKWILNLDNTIAVLQTNGQYASGYGYPDIVYVTNGSAGGTQLLAQNIYIGSDVYLMGNKIVITDGGSSSQSGLITDGTVPGTTVVADLPVGIVDAANQVIWSGVSTDPYGYELFHTTLTSTGATTAMVKDIYAGSNSGLGNPSYRSLLPNGSLIFTANDGIHGTEAWVSNGTEAGTFMLPEVYLGAESGFGWSGFQQYGDQVVFAAYLAYSEIPTQSDNASGTAGYQLIFTDGTSAGTRVLEVTPGQNSTSPTILGQANNLLYFTAEAPNADNVTTKGIYSTDSNTFTRLADINSSASLLGWDSSKAYFRVSDVDHGDELWVANLANDSFELVKDILAGSGSALGATTSSNSFMVSGKLAFNAYTSATTQNFFLSNGTEVGTVQLGGMANATKVLGDTLVFQDASGIYGVNTASDTPTAIALVNGLGGSSSLQADADQVFFTLANGDFYASNGSKAGTVKLASSVTSVKVVAENALYFIQDTPADPAALWYSDGTSAGTRFIEDLPGAVVDLSNAVAIVTVGVPV
jgi:uncharacterized repeat protein (TIGR02059 family)